MKPSSGAAAKGGARGNSAAAILDYCEDKEKQAVGYYGEAGTAPSRALGGGWEELGLEPGQQPTRQQLENLLNGKGIDGQGINGPGSRDVMVNKETGEFKAGYDLTFSSPKSVGAIYALADDEMRAKMRGVWAEADAAVVKYIEDMGYIINHNGANGKGDPAQKLIVQSYMHDVSREEDPQPHSHLIFFNLGKNDKGVWVRQKCDMLFPHKIEIGAVRRAVEAKGMMSLGLSVERDKTSYKIVGMPDELTGEWSKGRKKIEAELDRTGRSGAEESQKAAYKVRAKEKLHTSPEELRERWTAEAAALGVTVQDMRALQSEAPAGVAYEEAAMIAGLSEQKATFSHNDILKATVIAMAAGHSLCTAADVQGNIDKAVQNGELIQLVDDQGATRWTTRDMRETETRLMAAIESRKGGAKPIDTAIVERAIAEITEKQGFPFNQDQIDAVHHLCSGKNMDRFCEGVAGSGKTTLAAAVGRAYSLAGREVRGMALSGKASNGLAEGTGMEAVTIDSFLLSMQHGNKIPKPGSLILIDEAGMCGTRQLEHVLRVAQEHKLELGFIGDRKQLQSIMAGSAFGYMFDKAKDSEKTTINESVRQRGDHAGAWRDSLKAIRTADNKKVLGFLDGLGNLKLSKQSEEINDAAAAWQRNREAGLDDKNNIFITNRHDMRKRLNVAAREISGQAFRIDNVAVEIRNNAGEKAGIREFAPGDRVVTLKNMKLFGRNIAGEEEGAKTRFDNRALWTINQIKVVEDKTWIEMTSDKGTVARFNTEQMATLDHAYAVTTHMSQGMTAKGSVTLPSDMNMMDMSAWYVMLSRTSNAEYSHVVIPEHLLVEMEDELGIDRDAEAEETKEQRIETLHQRLEKFMVAVARERPDDLSLSFKLAEGQAEKLASNEKHKIEAAPIAQPITEDDQLEDLSTGRRKPHQAEPEAAQPADAKKAEHEEKLAAQPEAAPVEEPKMIEMEPVQAPRPPVQTQDGEQQIAAPAQAAPVARRRGRSR